jgi:hypothetical protein
MLLRYDQLSDEMKAGTSGVNDWWLYCVEEDKICGAYYVRTDFFDPSIIADYYCFCGPLEWFQTSGAFDAANFVAKSREEAESFFRGIRWTEIDF